MVITGGNTGIGFETAKALLRKGDKVVLACRDDAKAAAAVARLQGMVPGAEVSSATLDLADLSSVRDFSKAYLDSGASLDVLLNNAGVMACPEMRTADGFEMQLGVNHLGHFLLTLELLPLLTDPASPARLVNVASEAHKFGKINFADLNSDKSYSAWTAYGQSKLANVLFTYEMNRLLPNTANLTVNSLHPGVVATELGRYLLNPNVPQFLTDTLAALASPLLKTPQQGAETSIYLASSADVRGMSGKYFDNCTPVASSPASYDAAVARKLWELSVEMTGAPAPSFAAAEVTVA